MATIDLGNVPLVSFVADANTPANLLQYAGVFKLLIGPDVQLPAMGEFHTLVISGVSVPGYLRQGVNGLEWLMQPAPDPAAQALDAVPGADGWKSAAARNKYREIGAQLLARGVTLSEAQYVLSQLYQAATTNFVAAHPQD
jgi:hypothetical protein